MSRLAPRPSFAPGFLLPLFALLSLSCEKLQPAAPHEASHAVPSKEAPAAPPSASVHGDPPPDAETQALLKKLDGAEVGLREDLVRELFRRPGAFDALVGLLKNDPSPNVRLTVLGTLGAQGDPRMVDVMNHVVVNDPSDAVAQVALKRLRHAALNQLQSALDQRVERVLASGGEEAVASLRHEQEKFQLFARGTMLPSFLTEPPPLFQVKTRSQDRIRVLSFGDYGTGSPTQKQTADAMYLYHQKNAFDLAVTLGDNFYPAGMRSPADPRWPVEWEAMYDRLKIPFYATLGNHDWGLADSPAAEVLYTQKSATWRMPATRYTFVAGPVQFFALDTDLITTHQLNWFEDVLSKSKARWKIVYAHHPAYSHGAHGDTPGVVKRLLPMMLGRVHAFIAGHEHDLQHLKPEAGVHFLVVGGGGQDVRPIDAGPRSLFAASKNGFADLDINNDQIRFKYVGVDGKTLYDYTIPHP